MQFIYSVMEAVMPFSWVRYDFMKNAFLAIILITPLFGMIGTLVVEDKLAFFSDALGHSALTGIAIGMLVGIAEPTVSMVLFAVAFAWLLNTIKRTQVSSNDTIIGVFSSTAIALGLVLLSSRANFARFAGYLIGDILTIGFGEIIVLALVFAAVTLFWVFCFNRLLAMSISRSLAKTRHIPEKLLETVLMMVIAVVVTVSIKWVGILIINSLLVLPAAASRNIASGMRQYHFFSVLFSMTAGLLGLSVSYYLGAAAGPTVVLICACFFFLTYMLKKLRHS